MTVAREEIWLIRLASEVVAALKSARSSNEPMTEDNLAKRLGERPMVMELVTEVCRGAPQEVITDKKEVSYEQLQSKYNDLLDDLRRNENHGQEIEEAFKRLTNTLVALTECKDQPELERQLRTLRDDLKKKAVTGRLDASTKVLKEYIFRLDDKARIEGQGPKAGGFFQKLFSKSHIPSMPEAPAEAQPEGVEENVRDVLVLLVKGITDFEDQLIQKRAKALSSRIKHEFTIDDYKPFVAEIQDLIFLIKDAVRREKREAFRVIQEIMSRLEEAENDLMRNLEVDSQRLSISEREFAREVVGDIVSIEESFEEAGASLDQIRGLVLGKIASIRQRFKKKQAEDDARLKKLVEEKAGAEKRLKDIHHRYQEFTQVSQSMLQEIEKFRQASLSDGLTGTYNRRAYDLQIGKALEEFHKGRLANVALIVFDVDKFKDFNTDYGHRAGDKVLIHVAKFARSHLRKNDFLARYGGDEFAIILPEVDLATATRIAEQIKSGINEVEFKLYKDRELTVKIGLSMGISAGRPEDDPTGIFQRADRALYLAKDKGRNQIRTESELTEQPTAT